MKNKGFLYLFAFAAMVLAVGLACSALSSTPTTQPVSNPPTEQALGPTTESSTAIPGTDTAASTGTDTAASTGSDLVTFTDKNNFYQIDLPGDFVHSTSSGDHYYIDTFTSPDKKAVVENIAYDDGTPFSGGDNGKFALQILNQNYSNTGKEGDIKVTNDSIQKDGSERLTWSSKSGSYSGVSYFEIRNKTTFLMFTIDWGNDSESTSVDLLDKVVSSYRLPQ